MIGPNKKLASGYTGWVNVLDYSAAVLPVTIADKSVDVVDEGYQAIGDNDEMIWKLCEFPFPFSVVGIEYADRLDR